MEGRASARPRNKCGRAEARPSERGITIATRSILPDMANHRRWSHSRDARDYFARIPICHHSFRLIEAGGPSDDVARQFPLWRPCHELRTISKNASTDQARVRRERWVRRRGGGDRA